MSCCGRGPSLQRPSSTAAPTPTRAPAAPVTFEYGGAGAILVTGPLTGAAYRFAGPGARVAVHGVDAPSLVNVPGLKAVR